MRRMTAPKITVE
jgi:hypothetical protein